MDDDVDIYGDLPTFNANDCTKCKETSKELNEKNAQLEAEGLVWKKKCEAFEEEKKIILTNTSSLMKTARAEIARKDKMILELRRELEDLKFRRGIWNGAKTKRSEPKDLRKLPPAKQHSVFPRKAIPTIPHNDEGIQKPSLDQDVEDPEQKWEPGKHKVTLYGERLKRKIQMEEEAERTKREKTKASESIASPTPTKVSEGLVDKACNKEDTIATKSHVMNDKPGLVRIKEEEEEGELVEEKPQIVQPGPKENALSRNKSVDNNINSGSDSGRMSKESTSRKVEDGRKKFNCVVKSQHQANDLYESMSEEDYQNRFVNDFSNHDQRRCKADVGKYDANFNRDLRYDSTTKTLYDHRSRASRDDPYSDHDRRSRRCRESERSRVYESRSKSSYRSHSRTPERRTNDDKKYNNHHTQKYKSHRDKYDKRKNDVWNGYSSKDHCNKDNYDFRIWHEGKIDDQSSKGGSDSYRNYEPDHKSRRNFYSPEKNLRSKIKAEDIRKENRGIKRSRSHRERTGKEMETDDERYAKKRRSKHHDIEGYERDDVEMPQKSESSRENSIDKTIRKGIKVPCTPGTKRTSAHENKRDVTNAEEADTLNNLLDQVEARDKCILMLENEEVPLSPLIKPENQLAGSHSFREEKIENIEKFIQDYRYDEASWNVLGNDATSGGNDENNVANSTGEIVETLNMDMDDNIVDKKTHNELSENPKDFADPKTSIDKDESKKDIACHELERSSNDEKSNDTIDTRNHKIPSDETSANVSKRNIIDGKKGDGSTHENTENIIGDKESENFVVDENSKHIAIDNKSEDAIGHDKTMARNILDDVIVCVKTEDSPADKNFENSSPDKRNYEFDKTKEEISIDNKKQETVVVKKEEDIPIDNKKREIVVDKINKEIPIYNKKQEIIVDEKEEEIIGGRKTENILIDKEKEDIVTDNRNEEILINNKKEEPFINEKEEAGVCSKKKKVSTHKQKEEFCIAKRIEVTIVKKVQELAIQNQAEKVTIVKEMQEVVIEKKTREVVIGNEKEAMSTDKTEETVASDEKQKKVDICERLENENIPAKLEDEVTGKNLQEVGISNLGDSSTVTNVINDINSEETSGNQIALTEDICLDKGSKERTSNITTTKDTTDQKREDTSIPKKSRDGSIIDQKPENIEIHEEFENSTSINKKLQSTEATMKYADSTTNHEREIVSSDRKLENVIRVEKPKDFVPGKKIEERATDDGTKRSSSEEKLEESLPKNERKLASLAILQIPEIGENQELPSSEISPPLPPSPRLSPLPPLPPSPPPEDSDVSIFPKSQHIKQETEKLQMDKVTTKETKNRPRLPCLPIVSLYSRKRRGLVLADSASSHTMVKSAKETVETESHRDKSKSPKNSKPDQKLVLSLVKIKSTSKSLKIQSENTKNGPIALEAVEEDDSPNSVETWNVRQSNLIDGNNLENKTIEFNKPEMGTVTDKKTSHDDENSKDEPLPVPVARETDILVQNEAKDIENKPEQTQPEMQELEVVARPATIQKTSTSKNSASSKTSERGKRSALKTIASTVPINEPSSSNRRKASSKEKENQSKTGKPVPVMVIRRRRPVQLEDSSTVTTLVCSEREVVNKEDNRISTRRDCPARKRRIAET